MSSTIGQNVKRLIIHKMSVDAISSDGPKSCLAQGIEFLSSAENIKKGFSAASSWVQTAIEAVRQAADPNPWKQSTDEEIAGEILREIKLRSLIPPAGVNRR